TERPLSFSLLPRSDRLLASNSGFPYSRGTGNYPCRVIWQSLMAKAMNQTRWQTLMSALGLPPSEECYHALHAAYSEKHRFYHTVNHIDAVLTHFDGVKEIAEKPVGLELA